jgi:hypothetical protein
MNPDHLRRYTDLPAVLQVLTSETITLLPPSSWDDRNDRNLMLAYQHRRGLKSLLALCFAQAAETYHHWKVFASGNAGMCIVFEKRRVIQELAETGVIHSSVDYFTIAALRGGDPALDRIPFSKRSAYRDEKEFRLLFSSPDEELPAKSFAMPIAAIDRILINPWLPTPLAETVKTTIRRIPGCQVLPVLQSTVIEGPAWKQLAARVRAAQQ